MVGFAALPKHLLLELLGDDRLAARDEAVVFAAAAAWLGNDADRADDADAVVRRVRFALIDPEFLCDVVEPHALMQSPACRALVHDAYRNLCLPVDRRDVAPRTCHPVPCDAFAGERTKVDAARPPVPSDAASDAGSDASAASSNPFLATPTSSPRQARALTDV